MTMPRKLPFLHLNGPADGAMMDVQVDENGEPVEFYTLLALGNTDITADPTAGPATDILRSLYEREERLGDDGFYYVFLFRHTDVENPPMAA